MADINTSQRYDNVTIAVNDSHDPPRPAKIDGVPEWASSDETVLSVTPSSDGMSAVVDTVAPGTARVSVKVDADLGAGTKTITGISEDVNVTLDPDAQASVIVFNFGSPVSKT